MKDLSAEERPKVGSYANEIRDILTEAIEEAKTSIEAANLEKALAEESIDVTLPGKKMDRGTRHVLTQIMEEIEDIFVGMGYQVVEGYEVEKRSLQLRADESAKRSSCQRHAGHLLYFRGSVDSNPYITRSSENNGDP